jgi:hypothetical protein
MKASRKAIGHFVALLLFLNLGGCALLSRQGSRPPGGNGFAVVSYWSGYIHKSGFHELHYWNRAGKHQVLWRRLIFENNIDNENDLALFHGLLNLGPDSSMVDQVSRFFAATDGGPVADIADELILLSGRARNRNLPDVLRTHAIGRLSKQGDRYSIAVGEIGKDWGKIEVTRDELLKLIQDAREKGQLLKDPVFGTPYYKRDVTADLPK